MLAVFLISSCATRKVDAMLNDIETYMQDRPDSALVVIRAFDTTSLTTRSLRAHYSLLHAMALDKNWIDTSDVVVIAPAVAFYGKHGDIDKRAKSAYYLGRIQYNGLCYNEAILSFRQAAQWSEHSRDNHFRSLVFHALEDTYGATSLYEEALAFSDSALFYSLKAGDTKLANASRYRIAQNLNNLKRYIEADSLYRQLLVDSLVTRDKHLYPRVLSGYAMTVLGLNGDCKKARQLFEQCLQKGRFDSYNHWGAYAYCLAATGDHEKAQQIFGSLQKRGLESTFSYQGWKGRAESVSGNYDNAYTLVLNALDGQIESSRKILRQSIITAQLNDIDARNKVLIEKASARKAFSILAIFTLVTILFIVWQEVRNRMRKVEEENESLLETITKLTEPRFEDTMTEKYVEIYRTYLQKMGTIRDMLRSSGTEEGTAHLIQRLRSMMHALRLDKIRQGEFEAMINQEFDDVMIHYREEYPGANEAEYLVICYFFAGFDGATICSLAGLPSKQAVYSRKSRLVQKISSGEAPHKEQFLRMLR